MDRGIKVAVLGMGGMGRALAERAHDRGHDVVVWNRTAGKGGVLPEAMSAAEAVAAADVVLIVVHDDAAVRKVCSKDLLAALAPSTYLLIVSTVTPQVAREMEAGLPGRVLDTPVLSSPDMIRAGQGRFFVGGSADAALTVSPLLDDLGAGHTRCGEVGSGAVMKILSNAQLVVGVAALAEAVATARAQGVTDDVLTAVFGESIVISQAATFGLHAMLDPEHEGVLGPVGHATSDVRLALELAPELNLALSPAVLDLLARVSDRDWPDFSAVIEGLSST